MINEINSIELQGGYFSPSAKFEIFKNNDHIACFFAVLCTLSRYRFIYHFLTCVVFFDTRLIL